MILAALLALLAYSPAPVVTDGPYPGITPCPYTVGSPPAFHGCKAGEVYDMNELMACQQAYMDTMADAVLISCAAWDAANEAYNDCYAEAQHQYNTCVNSGGNPAQCLAQLVGDIQVCYENWQAATDLETLAFSNERTIARVACEACFANLCHPSQGVAQPQMMVQGPSGSTAPQCNDPWPDPPTQNDVAGYFDYPPTNLPNCEGGLVDLTCFTQCQQAWMTATASARSSANAAIQACENTRYTTVKAAYDTANKRERAAFDAYVDCILHETPPNWPYCKDLYCSERAAARAGYYQALHAADQQYNYCKQQVLNSFVTATAAATNAFNACTAGCCH